MAGTIPAVSMMQFVDNNGLPASGAKAYIYNSGTVTPAATFKDYSLTTGQEHQFPIVANARGFFPAIWLNDGLYRVRVTDQYSTVLFDEAVYPAIGASSTSTGGGDIITNITTYETGDVIWQPLSGTKTGWVRHNGRTLGSTSSGATERANADAESLFSFLWDNYSNTICPVSGGRGASASADWAANKTIQLLDLRGRAPIGLDDMGNSAASRLSGATFQVGDATTAGATGGLSEIQLTASDLPVITPAGTVTIGGSASFPSVITAGSPVNPGVLAAGSGIGQGGLTVSGASFTGSFIGSSFGGNGSHENMPPFALGTFYVRL